MSRLLEYSRQRLKTEEPLVLAGDFNVIPASQDVHNPAAWVNDALFRPTTRESFQSLLGLGLTDALRAVTDASGQYTCLLYTSDAADEEDSVDLGGRRIIKKKKKKKKIKKK